MFGADHHDLAELHDAADHVGRDIRTT